MDMKKPLMLFIMSLIAFTALSQGSLSIDRFGYSDFRNSDGERVGSGSKLLTKDEMTLPITMKRDEANRLSAWGIRINADYSRLNNRETAAMLNPHEILNTSITLAHIRPLAGRWSMIAALGVGIYAPTNYIRWKSLLGNGIALFIYKINDELSLGFGGGLTNSYGPSVVMPMAYVNWQRKGRYQFTVNFTGHLNVTGSTKLDDRWKITCTAVDMDGITAVLVRDGKTKVYSSTMIKSDLSVSYYITPQLSFYVGGGCVWRRSSRIAPRRIEEFFKGMFASSDKYSFGPSMRLNAGFRYGF